MKCFTRFKKYIILLISFLIHLSICFMLKLPSSGPDEVGAMSLAAYLAGYDWSNLVSQHGAFYGFATSWILTPLFWVIKDPIKLYFCMRVFIALLLSFPTLIAYNIMDKYYDIKNSFILCIGSIACSFFHNATADVFINEALLILVIWLIIYILTVLNNSVDKKRKIILSIVLGFVISYAVAAHTRALLFFPITICTLIFIQIFTKKMIVNWWGFLGSSVLSVMTMKTLINYVQNILFISKDVSQISGSIGSLEVSYGNITEMLNVYGVSDFFGGVLTIFTSNFYGVIIASAGLLLPLLIILIYEMKLILKYKQQKLDTSLNVLFCFIGLFVFLSAMGIMHVYHGVILRSGGNIGDGRFFFYLRYYINMMPPLLMVLLYYLDKKRIEIKKIAIGSLSLFAILFVGFFVSFAIPIIKKGYSSFDVGRMFSAYIFRYNDDTFRLRYYFIAGLVVVIISSFILILFQKNKKSVATICILIVLIYQQMFQSFLFRKPIVDNTYSCIDTAYNLLAKNGDFKKHFNNILVYSEDTYRLEYQAQLIFYDFHVESFTGKAPEHMLLLSNNYLDLEEAVYAELDENEFLYTNDMEYVDFLESMDSRIQFNQ